MRCIYIKVPLIFGTAQTLAYLMVVYLSTGVMELSLERVVTHFVVASLGGLVLAWLHVLSTSKDQRDTGKASEVRQQRQLTVFLSYDQSFTACEDALALIGARVIEESTAKGIIRARTGFSWRSFGEIITIHLRQATDNLVEIEVNSRPSVRTTLVDYGKNWNNVKAISDFLSLRGSKAIAGAKREYVSEMSAGSLASNL